GVAPSVGWDSAEALLGRFAKGGVILQRVTLHVGAGTFLPVKAADTTGHRMHSEFGTVSAETVQALNATRERDGRIVAVGSTALRLFERAVGGGGRLRGFFGGKARFLTPRFKFRFC